MDESSTYPNRRRFLATITAVTGAMATAGCSRLWDQTGATDVIVHNMTEGSRTVEVTITGGEAAEPHTSKTLEIPRGETVDPVNDSKLPTNDSYTVEVAVEGGPTETFQWSDPEVELAPLHVLVDGSRNIKFLLQAG